MTVVVVRGDARRLPLPAASVDLIVTSPPYFALRDYRDGEASLAGQIGSEPTPAAYIATLVDCTREWARVLKPGGSMFIDLGDKYSTGNGGDQHLTELGQRLGTGGGQKQDTANRRSKPVAGMKPKSLLLLPERYRIACVDQLGLIARAVLIWSKPNGLPESVTDRVRRSHEEWVHLVKQPRYFAAVDEIREAAVRTDRRATAAAYLAGVAPGSRGHTGLSERANHPLGSLPGSVWTIATEPLQVPAGIDADHFAAYPTEWPRRLILGWSPSGICTACGEGRRPVVLPGAPAPRTLPGRALTYSQTATQAGRNINGQEFNRWKAGHPDRITGYACACTPYTDHPGTGGDRPTKHARSAALGDGVRDNPGGGYGNAERTGPWREYHFDRWTPAPTRPSVILDPFGGTGTTAHVAAALGRIGITVDLSGGYSAKLAASPELYDRRRRKVLGLDPSVVQVVPEGQLMFEGWPA